MARPALRQAVVPALITAEFVAGNTAMEPALSLEDTKPDTLRDPIYRR
jgi:hypothetical protein